MIRYSRNYITRNSFGVHMVYLNCSVSFLQLGIVVHEIGHAMGFYHEQSRPQRDDHVYINKGNIQKTYRSNFDIVSDIGSYNVEYDLSSVMHYSAKVCNIQINIE